GGNAAPHRAPQLDESLLRRTDQNSKGERWFYRQFGWRRYAGTLDGGRHHTVHLSRRPANGAENPGTPGTGRGSTPKVADLFWLARRTILPGQSREHRPL